MKMAASAKKRDIENKSKENDDVTSSDVSSDEENVDNNDEKVLLFLNYLYFILIIRQ